MSAYNDTLKDFAFRTAKLIQLECNFEFARSHIYELLACYEGYHSYAAFRSGNILVNVEYDNSEEYEQHRLLKALTLDILNKLPETDYSNENWDDEDNLIWDDYEGREFLDNILKLSQKLNKLSGKKLPETFLLSFIKVIYREFLFLNLFYMNLRSLREALTYVDFENGYLDFIECDDGEFYDFEMIKNHLSDLQRFVEKGSKDAIGIIAKYYLYLANQIAPYGREGSNFGMVWNNEKMRYTGKTQAKVLRKKFDELIEISQEYQKMIEKFPVNLNEVDFKRIEITKIQLKFLANHGDIDAIEYLLYHQLFTDEIEAWTYIYVAQKLGTDFTEEDYYGIDTLTGARLGDYEYVDYTPVILGGPGSIQESIGLSKLDHQNDKFALERANQILQNIK